MPVPGFTDPRATATWISEAARTQQSQASEADGPGPGPDVQRGACCLLLNRRLCGGRLGALGHQAPNTMAWGRQTSNNGLSILTEGPL